MPHYEWLVSYAIRYGHDRSPDIANEHLESVFLLPVRLIWNFHFVSGGGFCLKGNRDGWV